MTNSSTMIQITKELVNDTTLIIFDSWVSNGHWAVRKDKLPDGVLFTDKSVVEEYLDVDVTVGTEEGIKKLVSQLDDAGTIFHKQPWIRQDGYGHLWRLFQSQDNENNYALFNEAYIIGLGIKELRGPAAEEGSFGSPVSGELGVMISSFRLGKEVIKLPGLSELL